MRQEKCALPIDTRRRVKKQRSACDLLRIRKCVRSCLFTAPFSPLGTVTLRPVANPTNYSISEHVRILGVSNYGTEIEGLPGPALLNLTESCGTAPYAFEQKGGAPVAAYFYRCPH